MGTRRKPSIHPLLGHEAGSTGRCAGVDGMMGWRANVPRPLCRCLPPQLAVRPHAAALAVAAAPPPPAAATAHPTPSAFCSPIVSAGRMLPTAYLGRCNSVVCGQPGTPPCRPREWVLLLGGMASRSQWPPDRCSMGQRVRPSEHRRRRAHFPAAPGVIGAFRGTGRRPCAMEHPGSLGCVLEPVLACMGVRFPLPGLPARPPIL